MPAAFAFALSRIPVVRCPLVVLAAPTVWLREYGRPYGRGLPGVEIVLVETATDVDGLWAMEQALRSGAVAGVIGAIEAATLAQSRRLNFAARERRTVGIRLRAGKEGLSAARRRWQIASVSSAPNPDDARAPGTGRLWAELVRSRDEHPSGWMMEQDDETHRLRLVDRLAGDGLVAVNQSRHAA